MDNLDMLLSRDEVTNLLAHLDEVDRKIVEGVFAFYGGEPKTYIKVAKELGISRERARQRCQRAMARLRVLANRNTYVR